jgi:hypothetical protein
MISSSCKILAVWRPHHRCFSLDLEAGAQRGKQSRGVRSRPRATTTGHARLRCYRSAKRAATSNPELASDS